MDSGNLHRSSLAFWNKDCGSGIVVRVLVTISELETETHLLDEITNVSAHVELIYKPCTAPDVLKEALCVQPEILYTSQIPEDIEDTSSLKWIQFHYTGMEEVLSGSLRVSNILITNVSGAHAIPIAEYVVGYMIML